MYNAKSRHTAITTSWLLCFSSSPQYIAISDPVVGNRSRRSLKHFLATSRSRFIASVEKFLHAFWQSGFSKINWRSLVIYLLMSPSINTYSLIFWLISSRMIISIWLWCSIKFQLSLTIPTVIWIETRGACNECLSAFSSSIHYPHLQGPTSGEIFSKLSFSKSLESLSDTIENMKFHSFDCRLQSWEFLVSSGVWIYGHLS